MENKNIIAFCGRKESGKTELAKICENYGYILISFADSLKKLISELISCNINDINKLKNIEKNYKFGAVDCNFISNETKIPIDIVKKEILNKNFKTVRELLQIIGTNLIRKYNPDWHVEQLSKKIEPNKKYVIDDVRFKNEAEFVKNNNGDCWFIIRPKLDNISNHESETSLKWQDFENIIFNDKTLSYLKFNWTIFMENGYDFSMKKRKTILDNCNENTINILSNSNTDFTLIDGLFINKYIYDYKKMDTYQIEKITVNENKLLLNNILVNNPLLIEDLKIYI